MDLVVAALALAWVAIVLLGLGMGGLMAQLRTLQSARAYTSPDPVQIGPLAAPSDGAGEIAPPYAALFVRHDCKVCAGVLDSCRV